VHLGFIKPYIMIPARGEIIKSSPRRWLTVRDIQGAFFAARLRLTDLEVKTLMDIVVQFARGAKTITLSSAVQDNTEGQPSVTASGSMSLVASEDAEAVVQAGRLSSKWFALYMVHLRLQRPSKPWLQWLGTKLKQDEVATEDKPKEFQKRVLAGKPSKLSKTDIESFLTNFEVLPEQFLREEIDRRVEVYALDMRGRMDIQHDLKFKLQLWERANPGPHKAAEIARVSADLKEELLRKFRLDLVKKEEDEGAITKDLFWKFDAACRKDNYTLNKNFGKWLEEWGTKQREQIETFKADTSSRRTSSSLKCSRKHSYAAFNEVEDLIKTLYELLPPELQALQLQFRKALISLRRDKDDAKLPSSRVITKELFDRNFTDLLLSPHINEGCGNIVWKLALEARHSHDWRFSKDSVDSSAQFDGSAADDIFSSDIAVAVQRSKNFEERHRSSVSSRVSEWEAEKLDQMKKAKAKKVRSELA
jgi:hypothetical protein